MNEGWKDHRMEMRKEKIKWPWNDMRRPYNTVTFIIGSRHGNIAKNEWNEYREQGSLCTYFELVHTSHTLSSHRSNHFALASINLSNKFFTNVFVCLFPCMIFSSFPTTLKTTHIPSHPRPPPHTHTQTHTRTLSFRRFSRKPSNDSFSSLSNRTRNEARSAD